jgi:hypothetical protein
MKIDELSYDREQAREMYEKYLAHRAYQKPHDAQIAAIYKRLAQGKTVIRALQSIRDAGLGADGFPKLAIARADMPEVYLHVTSGRGEVTFGERWQRSNASKSKNITLAWSRDAGAPTSDGKWNVAAAVPLIPVHLRPRRGIENYHVLWEAEWSKRYPVDPYLLRRFGEDAWLVVAAWDLTDVERAVMSQRLSA